MSSAHLCLETFCSTKCLTQLILIPGGTYHSYKSHGIINYFLLSNGDSFSRMSLLFNVSDAEAPLKGNNRLFTFPVSRGPVLLLHIRIVQPNTNILLITKRFIRFLFYHDATSLKIQDLRNMTLLLWIASRFYLAIDFPFELNF